MRRSGFTLIELLVVVAIIGLLIGILVPVVHRVQAQARRSACAALVKEVRLALESYNSDTGKYPEDPWLNWPAGGGAPADVAYPPPYPTFVWFLMNGGRLPYLNMKDEHLIMNSYGRDDPAIAVKDPWDSALLYVAAPRRRDHPLFRFFPGGGTGEYNLWSVGPDQKCDSCQDAPSNGGLTYAGSHADGIPAPTLHLGGDSNPNDDIR